MFSGMRDLRKALGDVYSDKKGNAESDGSGPEGPAPMPLDDDLARALSAALAEVPSVEHHDLVEDDQPDDEVEVFDLDAELPKMDLVIPALEADIQPDPEPLHDFEPERESESDHTAKPSGPRPTPKMAAWLTGADKPGAAELEAPAEDEGDLQPLQVWQLSDDDILPARSGGGRRRPKR
jgi:hypothetical protein